MLFPTITFAVFLTLVLAAHTVLLKRPRAWKTTMLVASYVFYAWWDWRFLTLIWISTLVDYGTGIAIDASSDPRRRKAFLIVSLATNLGMLGVFKYADFFVTEFVNLMADLGMTVSARPLGIILPVGISFYTFQSMSYTIDVYRGRLRATRNIAGFFAYLSLFPQLVVEESSRIVQIPQP
jgi:D-alanyl-lipoteichoic acid acyltransferase DltB (MBOAT superfamily)